MSTIASAPFTLSSQQMFWFNQFTAERGLQDRRSMLLASVENQADFSSLMTQLRENKLGAPLPITDDQRSLIEDLQRQVEGSKAPMPTDQQGFNKLRTSLQQRIEAKRAEAKLAQRIAILNGEIAPDENGEIPAVDPDDGPTF